MLSPRLTGSIVAIATPMQAGGALDLPALARLIEFHIAEGTSGIVIVGTTGESPTVDFDEHCLLIKTAVETVRGRIRVIAGTGANSTSEAIELTEFAKKAGVDSCLSVVPYYNKPTQEGMYRHFRAIAERTPLPMVLYNVPGRTGADLSTETTLRLADVPGIVGIKDATADVGRGSELIKALALAGHRDFAVYSGEDITALPLILMGGHGVISVTANVAPKLMAQMCAAAIKGDVVTARERNNRMLGLHRKLFIESNPIPTKWALAEMGMIKNELRLPLVPLSPQYHEAVRAALREAGCLV
jgi:4-hydroxy-tetrahydrodipicolinate synthase